MGVQPRWTMVDAMVDAMVDGVTEGPRQSEAQWLDEKRYSTVPPSWQASRAQR